MTSFAGGQTEEEVLQLCTQSKEVFHDGGFNLRKFLTNSKSAQQQIELMETSNQPLPDEPTYSESTLGTSQSVRVEEHKVLESHGILKLIASISMSLILPSLQRTSPRLREML